MMPEAKLECVCFLSFMKFRENLRDHQVIHFKLMLCPPVIEEETEA